MKHLLSKAMCVGIVGALLLVYPFAIVAQEETEGAVTDTTIIIETASGPVQGVATESHHLFQGIPYATAQRWQAPQPVSPWIEPLDATAAGSLCPQEAQVFANVSSVDENCLFLNITSPADVSADVPKPVMVWLHGGGGTNGGGHLFDSQRLVTTGDVVVVTLNWRLGILGAFGYPGLESSGTFGLQDQQVALRWVQDNIAAFGGDPNNVTLFGESYGAYMVAAQLTSPASDGLFHRAVMQSGFALIDYPPETLMPGTPELSSLWISPEELDGLGAMIAEQLGCADPTTALDCLRTLPVEALLPLSSIYTRYAYGNSVLPVEPSSALLEGRFHRIPVISGATRDEARLFVGLFFDLAGQPVTEESYPTLLASAFGDNADAVAAEYPLSAYDTPSLAWAAVITDRVWALGTMKQHQALAAQVPTYAFEFADQNAPPNLPFPSDFPPGAYHNSEVIYQFELAGEVAPLTPEQWQLAEAMNRYWTNFARTGDPNDGDLPVWQPFDLDDTPPYVQSLAPGEGGIAAVDYAAEHRLDFWRTLE